MIKTSLLVIGALVLTALPAAAATRTDLPTAVQKAEFYATCMKIAHNSTLCGCKADAAMSLVDERFMAIVIAAMEGRTPPVDETQPYAVYIGQSNKICIPGY